MCSYTTNYKYHVKRHSKAKHQGMKNFEYYYKEHPFTEMLSNEGEAHQDQQDYDTVEKTSTSGFHNEQQLVSNRNSQYDYQKQIMELQQALAHQQQNYDEKLRHALLCQNENHEKEMRQLKKLQEQKHCQELQQYVQQVLKYLGLRKLCIKSLFVPLVLIHIMFVVYLVNKSFKKISVTDRLTDRQTDRLTD